VTAVRPLGGRPTPRAPQEAVAYANQVAAVKYGRAQGTALPNRPTELKNADERQAFQGSLDGYWERGSDWTPPDAEAAAYFGALVARGIDRQEAARGSGCGAAADRVEPSAVVPRGGRRRGTSDPAVEITRVRPATVATRPRCPPSRCRGR
jgi:hypothetical protein